MRLEGAGVGCTASSDTKERVNFGPKPLYTAILAALTAPGLAAANTITLEGSTATDIRVQGDTTDITTRTIRGNSGFNSFGRFEVATGRTVNLYVPDSADNLVNLVHDARAQINGTLNGVKDGRIGGNIVFADPHGMVVGASGVVNVGSLVVTTPSAAEMQALTEKLRDPSVSGEVMDEEVARLMRGDYAASDQGEISIQGQVNANGGINLFGAAVLVEKGGRLEAGTDVAREVFETTVNTDGLAIGTGVERADGAIRIVATGDARIEGELAALMADDSGASVTVETGESLVVAGQLDVSADAGRGGEIRLEAEQSVSLEDGALVDASGREGGGQVVIGGDTVATATQETVIAEGVQVRADALAAGDGGEVTVVARERTEYAGTISARGAGEGSRGGAVELSSRGGLKLTGQLDLASPEGKAGSLLIDPETLNVVEGAAGDSTEEAVTVGWLQAQGDIDITLEAEDRLTVGGSDGSATDLDLSSTLENGSLTLRSGVAGGEGDLVVNAGSRIRTGGGDVTLQAGEFDGSTATGGELLLEEGARIETDGGDVTLQARESITQKNSAVINTRNVAFGNDADSSGVNSIGDSGAITLEAPQITLEAGSALLAFTEAGSSREAGDVTLSALAQAERNNDFSSVTTTAAAAIDIGGVIQGGKVALVARAEALSGFTEAMADDDTLTAANVLTQTVDFGYSVEPIEASYFHSHATADIDVAGTANISASEGLTLDAWAAQSVSLPEYDIFSKSPIAIDVVAGKVSGGATAEVQDGAQISASGVDISARNQADLSVTAMVQGTEASADVAFALGLADITTAAKVHDGATIQAGEQGLNLAALSRNNFSVSASALAAQSGRAGIAAAMLFPTLQTTATLGGEVDSDGNVIVTADTFFDTLKNSASTTTGSGFVAKNIIYKLTDASHNAITGAMGKVWGMLSQKQQNDGISGGSNDAPTDSGSTSTPKLASAFALTNSDVTTEAAIIDAADVSADGGVAVTAKTAYQSTPEWNEEAGKGLHNTASAEVESEAKEDATVSNPEATKALSAAIAAGWYENTAKAWIGKGAQVNAERVQVQADVVLPIAVTWWNVGPWDDMSSVTGFLSDTIGKANLNAGLLGPQVFTSFASAKGAASDLNIAGALNYLGTSNTAQAWVDEGAVIEAEGSGGSSGGSDPDALAVYTAEDMTLDSISTRDLDADEAVTVKASSQAHTLNGAGNINLLLSGTTSTDGTSVGLGFSFADHGNIADAWVARGASITSAEGMAVIAEGDDLVINLTPSSGMGKLGTSGGPFTGNGTLALTRLQNRTNASISNAALVTLDGALNLDANQELGVWSGAGVITHSKTGGVGPGIAFNWVDTDTVAFIGDNDDKLESGATGPAQCGETGKPACVISASEAAVTSVTEGRVMALGVAGSVTSGSSGSSGGSGDGLKDSLANSFSSLKNMVTSKVSGLISSGKTSSAATVDTAAALSAPSAAIEGSSGLVGNLASLPTGDAASDDAAEGIRDQAKSDYKDDDGLKDKAAGNTTPTQTQQAKYGFTVSGSIAANASLGETAAYVEGATLELDGGLDVDATRRTVTFAGAGSAAWRSESASGDYSAAVAGALGVNVLADSVSARVVDSAITQSSVAPVNVEALRGGLAGAVGSGTTVADGADVTVTPSVSLTIGVAETEAYMDGSSLTSAGGDVTVRAYDHMNVATGGGSLYKGGSRAGIGGAVSFNLLVNQTRAGLYGASITGADDVTVEARSPARIIGTAAVAGFGSQDQQANFAGAFVVNNIVNTTVAEVGGDEHGNATTITADGTVSVAVQDDDEASLDDRLGDLGNGLGDGLWQLNEGFDLTGAELPSGSSASMGDADLDQEEGFGDLSRSPNIASPTTGADAGGSIIGAAGMLQQNSASVSGGLSVVYNGIYTDYRAEVGEASITTPGDVAVSAENGGRIYGLSVGAGIQSGSGSFAGMGSVAVNVIASNTEALLGSESGSPDDTRIEGDSGGAVNSLNVTAEDSREIFSAAGNIVATSSQLSVAIAAGVNVADGDVGAKVRNADIQANTMTVSANSAAGIASLAASAGTLNLNLDYGRTHAWVDDSRILLEDGDLTVAAQDSSALWGAAGGAAIARDGATLGLAAAVNVSDHDTEARLSETGLSVGSGDVAVTAQHSGFAAAGAVGASGSSGLAGGISLAVNVASSDTAARVSGLHARGDSAAAAEMANLAVDARDTADIWSLGGEVAIGTGSMGAGGAVTVAWADAGVEALVEDSLLKVDNRVDVAAQGSGFIGSVGVAMAGGSGLALGGVLSVNGIDNTISAGIVNTEQEDVDADTLIYAADVSDIWSAALGVAGAQTASAGFALSGNGIGTEVSAYLHGDGTAASPAYRGEDVTVVAESSGGVHSLGVAGAAAGQFAAAGSVVVNALTGSTLAEIAEGALVLAQDDVVVRALGERTVDTFAGGFAFSLGFGAAGISSVVNVLNDSVVARVSGSDTRVTALGRDEDDSPLLPTGELSQGIAMNDAIEEAAIDEDANEDERGFEGQQQALADSLTAFNPEAETAAMNGLSVNALSLQQARTAGGSVTVSLDPTSIVKLVGGVVAGAATAGTGLVATLVGSGSGVAMNATVNVLSGNTAAYIDQAAINQAGVVDEGGGVLSAGSEQAVNVTAASHQVVGALAFMGSLGSAAGAGAAATVTVADRITEAYVRDSQLDAAAALDVRARGSEAVGAMAAGFSGALLGLGLGGTATVNVLDASVLAEVSGGSLSVGSLSIGAEHDASVGSATGVLAGGALAAGALPASVTVSSTTTEARLGRDDVTTALDTDGAVVVDADSRTALMDLVAGTGVSGGLSGAGAVGVNVLGDRTLARVQKTDFAQRAERLDVTAYTGANIHSYVGSAGLGAVAANGLSTNVNVLNTMTLAEVRDSDIRTGSLNVSAEAQRDIDMITLGLAGSTQTALGGSIGIAIAGAADTGASGDSDFASAWSETADQRNDTDSLVTYSATASERQDGTGLPATGPGMDSVSAGIYGGQVDASGDVTVEAREETTVRNLSGGVGVGLSTLGLGGGLAYTYSASQVEAVIDSDVEGAALNLLAWSGGERDAQAFAGGAGAVGIGAAVADTTANNQVTAELAGSVDASGDVTIGAADESRLKAEGYGAEVGAATLGAVVAVADKETVVSARLADGASLSGSSVDLSSHGGGAVETLAIAAAAGLVSGQGALALSLDDSEVISDVEGTLQADGAVTIAASDTTEVAAEADGGSVTGAGTGAMVATAKRQSTVSVHAADGARVTGDGGLEIKASSEGAVSAIARAASVSLLGSVDGTVATARDESTVSALAEGGATLNGGSSDVVFEAWAMPQVSAETLGVQVSAGISVGGSVASATHANNVSASLADSASLIGSDVAVRAMLLEPDSAPSARAKAVAVSGGALLGANAAVALAQGEGTVATHVDAAADLQASGEARVQAFSYGSREAEALGKSAGLLAAGASVAEATSDVTTTATLDGGVSGHAGTLLVTAQGEDDNSAETTAGSGGVVSGAAASSKTATTSVTTATLNGAGVIEAESVEVSALHTARFNGAADSRNAAVVGASGASVNHEVDTDTDVVIGDGVQVNAGSISVLAQDELEKPWLDDYNVLAGSGGVASGASALGKTEVEQDTDVVIGAGAELTGAGDENIASINLQATNELTLKERVRLHAGGVIASTLAKAMIDVVSDADVLIGSNASLVSDGGINVGTLTLADAEAQANAKTEGLAGAAAGDSSVLLNTAQHVSLASGARLWAAGDIWLRSGADVEGDHNFVSAKANTDIWNKTATPVNDADAEAEINQSARLDISGDVVSLQDIYLVADEGVMVGAAGQSKATDLNKELQNKLSGGKLSAATLGGSSRKDIESLVQVDGQVEAGAEGSKYLTLDWDDVNNEIIVSRISDGITLAYGSRDVASELFEELEALRELRNYYNNSAETLAAIEAEIASIEFQLRRLGALDDSGNSVPSSWEVPTVEVDGLRIGVGDVRIFASEMVGSGTLSASADAELEVINNTPAYLWLGDITVPSDEGGRVVVHKGDLELNPGSVGFSGTITTSAAGSEPSVLIHSTYESTGEEASPDIYINGDITNPLGSVTIINDHGGLVTGGDITAGSLNVATGGDMVMGYSPGFKHIGYTPEYLWSDITRGMETGDYFICSDGENICEWKWKIEFGEIGGVPVPVPTLVESVVTSRLARAGDKNYIVEGDVFIASRYININGTIQSGKPDYILELSSLPASWIEHVREQFFKSLLLGNPKSLYLIPTAYRSGNVVAQYDVINNRIVVEDVEVKGGYVELYGEILNTGGGKIKALDGYGKIDIVNNTGLDLVVQELDTGHGVDGVVRITDLGKLDSEGKPITTIYTSDGAYNPLSGQRYHWATGEGKLEIKKTIETFKTHQVLPISDDFNLTEWEGDYDDYESHTSTSVTGESEPLPENAYYADSSGGYDGYSFSKEIRYEDDWSDKIVDVDRKKTKDAWIFYKEYKWTITTTQTRNRTDIYTHSVAADHAIDIDFIGYDKGSLEIDSNAGVFLEGGLRNLTGTTSINADFVERLSDAADLQVHDLSLVANDGGLGAADSAGAKLSLELAASGVVSATATGDINLSSPGQGLTFSKVVSSDGDVRIETGGDLLLSGSDADNLIAGRQVYLDTAGDIAVAGSSALVNIDTGEGTDGLLTALGSGTIRLAEVSGDVRVNTIHGDRVTLSAEDGRILDGNSNDTRDTRTEEQLLQLWDSMALLEEDGALTEAEEGVAAIKATREAEYQEYWQLRGLSNDGSGWSWEEYDPDYSFSYSAEERSLLQSQGMDDASIAAMESWKTQRYHDLHAQFGEPASYDASYSYTPDAAAITDGAVWTRDELTFTIDRSLFTEGGTPVDTETLQEEANIVANDITLMADKGSIGALTDEPMVIDLANLADLTDEQKVALLSAERNDMSLEGTILTIIRREDVDLKSTSGVVASARDAIYLGGEEDVNVDDIRSPLVRIKAGQSIIGTREDAPLITADTALLEAAHGDIQGVSGSSFGIAVDQALTARAQDLINLTQYGGDLNVDSIVSGNAAVSVNVDAGGLYALYDGLPTIVADSLSLDVAGDLGSESRAVAVSLDNAGQLDGSVGGEAWLSSESDLNLGSLEARYLLDLSLTGSGTQPALTILGDIHAGAGGMHIAAGELQLEADKSVESDGDLTAEVDGAILSEAGSRWSAGGELVARAQEEVTLGEGGSMAASDSLELEAGSLYLGTGSSLSAGGDLSVNADGSITLGKRAGISSGKAARITTGGDLLLAEEAGIDAGEALDISAADLELAANSQMVAGAGASVDVATLEMAGGSRIRAGGGLEVTSAGDISVAQMESGSGQFVLVSNNGAIRGVDTGVTHLLAPASAEGSRIEAQGSIGEASSPLRIELGHLDSLESHTGDIYLQQLAGWQADTVAAVAGDVRIEGDGHTELGTLVADTLRMDVDRLTAGEVTVAGVSDLDTRAGLLQVASLDSGGAVTLDSLGGGIHVGALKTPMEAAATVHDSGDLTIVDGETGSHMSLTNEGDGDIVFGHPGDPDVAPDHFDLRAGDTLTLLANGDILGGNAMATNRLDFRGRNITFGAVETSATDIYLEAEVDVTGERAVAARDLTIFAGGSLNVTDTQWGGEVSLKAGRDMGIGVGGDVILDGEIEAGRDMVIESGGRIEIANARAGRDMVLQAENGIRIEGSLEAGAETESDYDIYETGNLELQSGGDLFVGEAVLSSGRIDLDVAGEASVGTRIEAAGELLARIGGDLTVGERIASDTASLDLDVAGSLSTRHLYAGTWMDVVTGGSQLDLVTALAGDQIRMLIGTSDGQQYLEDGSLSVQRMAGTDLFLRTGDSISIDEVNSSSALDIGSRFIELNQVNYTGGDALTLTVAGNTRPAAESMRAHFNADRVVSDYYSVNTGILTQTGHAFEFQDARNVALLDLTTNYGRIVMNNDDLSHVGADVQLREQDRAFWLRQEGTLSYTNAYVLHHKASHQVQVPNFFEQHESEGDVEYVGSNAAKFVKRVFEQLPLPPVVGWQAVAGRMSERMPIARFDLNLSWPIGEEQNTKTDGTHMHERQDGGR